LALAKTKTPSFAVIRGAIGYPIGTVRQSVEVFLEFLKGKLRPDGDAVVHYMQV
jgi:hypothetical protein